MSARALVRELQRLGVAETEEEQRVAAAAVEGAILRYRPPQRGRLREGLRRWVRLESSHLQEVG